MLDHSEEKKRKDGQAVLKKQRDKKGQGAALTQ